VPQSSGHIVSLLGPLKLMRTRLLTAILAILTVAMTASQLCAQATTSQSRPQTTPTQSGTITTDQTSIRAGESITFHIVLDKPTNAPDSTVTVVVMGPGVGAQNTVGLESGKTTADVPIVIPADAPGGEWHLEVVNVQTRTGMHYSNLKHDRVMFTVIQKATFDLPTEAKVSISLSQTQLLRREAGILQSKVEALKGAVFALPAGEHDPRAAGILRENLLDADNALEKTETEFLQLESTQSQKPAATIFFGDLHLTYQRALANLNASLQLGSHVQAVKQKKQSLALEDSVVRAFELNQLAYDVVANAGSLTFDLKVNSFPPGAVVSYGRRGDSALQHLQDPTNSEIEGLPYAIWLVRFEESGYAVEQREHNPFTDKNHVITVELHSEKTKLAK
jgi:hypothetical protein